MTDLDQFTTTVLELANMASEISVVTWRDDLSVTYKSDGSSLTQADLSIEAKWRAAIRAKHPTHGILGEEFGAETGQSAHTWVLDPIDGTRQFGAGLLNFTSLICLCRDGVPVLGIIDLPVPGARYVGVLGKGTTFNGKTVHTRQVADLDQAVIALASPDSFTKSASSTLYQNLRSAGQVRVFDGSSLVYGSPSRGLIDVCLNGDDLDAFDICALCPAVQEAGE